ncbi:MAG: hypothetical protein U5O15_09080 [Candidatus Krumholzibacteriota bacterium]|nr:hypothetical protein [Candidatus Krumholzibacteriota bacterium]
MDNNETKDESLVEINFKLKTTYFRRLILLSVLFVLTIVLSLALIILNETLYSLKSILILITIVLSVAVTILGLMFIVSILNPRKYSNIADKLLKDEEDKIAEKGEVISKALFIEKFITLEITMREFLESNDIKVISNNINNMYTYKNMVYAYINNGYLDRKYLDKFMELGKIRNLVVHGRKEDIDTNMLKLVEDAITIISRVNKDRSV